MSPEYEYIEKEQVLEIPNLILNQRAHTALPLVTSVALLCSCQTAVET